MMTEPPDEDCGAAGTSSGSSGGSRLSLTASRTLPGRPKGLSPPPSAGRLTSLRSRDLTLGGFKKPKKTYEPNIKAVRKVRDESKEETKVVPRKERREREDRNRENRGRRRERPPTIQSHSIFEQGPADTIRKTAWRGPTVCDASTSTEVKFVKKEKGTEDDEDEILSKLQRDDFIDDPGLRNDDKLRPIQLPLCQSNSLSKSQTSATTATCREDIGREDIPSSATEPPLFRTAPYGRGSQSRTEQPRPEQPSAAELFKGLSLSGREELFFIQLPDCMPGRPPASKDDSIGHMPEKPAKKEGKVEDRRTAHLKAQDTVVQESCPVLSDFPEGMLGKLQIRKSGKVQLKLGDIIMDVSEGAAFSFLQQLVCVRLSDGRTGDMTVLGNVQHKLVCSPDFQALLQETPQESTEHR